MKKKGFTLVELLAVIAILAILVIIALPNVLNIYRNSRENLFVEDVQNILRSAEQQYITDTMNGDVSGNICYDSSKNKLDIDAKSNLNYKIKLSNDGKITSIEILDNNYQLIKTNLDDISRDEIGSSKSEKTVKIEARNKETGLLDCEGKAIVEGTATEPEENDMIKVELVLPEGLEFSNGTGIQEVEPDAPEVIFEFKPSEGVTFSNLTSCTCDNNLTFESCILEMTTGVYTLKLKVNDGFKSGKCTIEYN